MCVAYWLAGGSGILDTRDGGVLCKTVEGGYGGLVVVSVWSVCGSLSS